MTRKSIVPGVLWLLAAAICFTIETSLMKLVGPGWSSPLQLFWRQVFALILIMPWIAKDVRGALTTTRPIIMGLRSLFGVGGLLLSIYAFTHLPLAIANTLSYTRPLWMVVLSILLLKEQFRLSRLAFVFFGFAGVLVALAPGGNQTVHWDAVAASLGAAFLFALSLVSIKSMTVSHSAFTLLCYAVILGLILDAPFAIAQWRTPDITELMLFAAMGTASVGSIVFYVKGLEAAEASLVSNVDYVRLVFAFGVGAAFFHEHPSVNLMIGSAVIIGSVVAMTIWNQRSSPPNA